MSNFRSGTEAAEKAAARSSFHRLKYLGIKDGQNETIRMLSGHEPGTGFLTVDQHNGSPTRTAPKDFSGSWPQQMTGVCRNDEAFDYPDCFLCIKFAETGDKRSYKKSTRDWALGVIRKPRMENGRQVGMDDSMIEIERDGVTISVPEIVMMNFAWSNFWAPVANCYVNHGTWNDRDIFISRKGTELDTMYHAEPDRPCTTTGISYEIAVAKFEANPGENPDPGPAFDTRLPQHAGPYLDALDISPEDLAKKFNNDPQLAFQAEIEKIVTERSDDEYYAQFFDTRVDQPESKSKDSGETANVTPPPVQAPSTPQPDVEDLAALAARVQESSGYGAVPVEPASADSSS